MSYKDVLGRCLPLNFLIRSSNLGLSYYYMVQPIPHTKQNIHKNSSISGSYAASSSNTNPSNSLVNYITKFKSVLDKLWSRGFPISSSKAPSNIKFIIGGIYF